MVTLLSAKSTIQKTCKCQKSLESSLDSKFFHAWSFKVKMDMINNFSI